MSTNIEQFKDRAYVVQMKRHPDGGLFIPRSGINLPTIHLNRKAATEAAAATRKLLGLKRPDVRVLMVNIEMTVRWA
jgi:hypothetical protein